MIYMLVSKRFVKDMIFITSDHLPCGGCQSSPSPSASVLPSLFFAAVIFGELVTGVPPSVLPSVADDTSLPLVVLGTASVLITAAIAVVGIPAICRAEKMVYMLLSKPFF